MSPNLDLSGQVRIVCMTRELAAMRHHYENVLGLEVLEIFQDDHGVLLRLRGDTEIQLINAEDGPTTGMRLSVEVDSADESYRHLSAVAETEPASQPWGHRNFITVDPAGNRIAFFEVLNTE